MRETRSYDPGLNDKSCEGPALTGTESSRQIETSRTGPEGAPTSAPPAWCDSLNVPRMIGRYEIRQLLGAGGFGTVYLGWDPELERSVAIKVPRHAATWTEATIAEFVREARLATRIRDPRIVTIHDVGRCGTHGVYLVMEFVHGRSLAERMKEGSLSVMESCRIVAEAAEAMHAAHRQGIVHRDLKPSNILLSEQDEVRVSDFGLAVHESNQAALKGKVSGTLAYMSPEQLRGEPHLIDGRSDIWSLGVILYRLLSGRLPFQGDCYEDIVEDVHLRNPKPLGQIRDDVDPRLDALCRRCLARNPDDRFTTAREFARGLQALQGNRQRRTAASFLIRGILAVIAIMLGVMAWQRLDWRAPRDVDPPIVISPRIGTDSATPASGTRSLLASEPVPFAFNSDNELNMFSFPAGQEQFTLVSDGLAMFVLGECDLPRYEFFVDGTSRYNSGNVGVFWGLHRDLTQPKSPYLCSAVQVSRSTYRALQTNYLQQLTLEGNSPHIRLLTLTHTLDSITNPLPPRELDVNQPVHFSLRVLVEDGRPVAIECALEDVKFRVDSDDDDWSRFAKGRLGILVANGHFVIRTASLSIPPKAESP